MRYDLDLAHRALPIAPEEAHYGTAGDYFHCRHYLHETDTPNWLLRLDSAKTPANSALRYGEITPQKLAAHLMRATGLQSGLRRARRRHPELHRRTALATPTGPELEADFVIVGAGAAGCVLASRLSASGRARVLVLEAGGADRHWAIRVPAGFRHTIDNPRLNWGYKTAPCDQIGARALDFPRGRVLGGASSINGHLFVRGQAADYDHWAQQGCRGWSWDGVLPYFMRAKTRAGGDPAKRGQGGPLIISDQREPHPLCHAFFDAAAAEGLAPNPDYNSGAQDGTGLYQQMMRSGRRWSAADAYLRPALGRANLMLISNAMVEGIELDGRRATGVRYRVGGSLREARAGRAVILAGGAINSPQLLQLSGIGDGAHLQSIGLPVAHHLPGVGQNLRDHYAVRMAWRVSGAPTLNERSRGPRLALEILKYALLRRGCWR